MSISTGNVLFKPSRKDGGIVTPEQVVAVYSAGWDAMEWLAQHAKNDSCPPCTQYHRAVKNGGDPRSLATMRCRLAQVARRNYRAVAQMRLDMNDAFDCDLADGKNPCSGKAEWALAERMTAAGRVAGRGPAPKGALIGFHVGCEVHARTAEARAVVGGKADRFSIEKLEDVAREGADKMR